MTERFDCDVIVHWASMKAQLISGEIASQKGEMKRDLQTIWDDFLENANVNSAEAMKNKLMQEEIKAKNQLLEHRNIKTTLFGTNDFCQIYSVYIARPPVFICFVAEIAL